MKPWLRTRLDNLIHELETHIHLPYLMVHGCCRSELENVASSTYDWARLGVKPFANDPSEADLMIVGGWINSTLAEEMKIVYSQLCGRRSVIAVGACSITGGPYATSNEKVIRVADILPVDVYVPGCPPRPEALIDAIRMLKSKMQPGPDHNSVLYAALRDNTRA